MGVTKEKIVIIGGGFAGLNLVKRLDPSKFEITLIDRNNYHSFPPLFYQVASGGLDPGSISFPFRREMGKRRLRGSRFHLGEVEEIDVARREVKTRDLTVSYDRLIIAAGTTNNFFGNDELPKYVFTMKSTTEAIRIRNEILDRLERASASTDADERRRLLHFVVVGAGPTGVEIAGALGDMKRHIIGREYPEINPEEISITILEGSDRVLHTMSVSASEAALRYLNELSVNVMFGKRLQSYDGTTITLADGGQIQSETVIWTAGVTACSFKITGADITLGPGNRFETDEYNRVKGLDNVYAVGDISYCPTEKYPKGLPQLAQPAIQQARNLARNLNAGSFTRPMVYSDRGSMATIGRNRAVADVVHGHLYGFFAWAAWMLIHLLSLLGMRNKATVLINWIWAYFTYTSSLLLLFAPSRLPLRRRWNER